MTRTPLHIAVLVGAIGALAIAAGIAARLTSSTRIPVFYENSRRDQAGVGTDSLRRLQLYAAGHPAPAAGTALCGCERA